jgi:hypothetical protein
MRELPDGLVPPPCSAPRRQGSRQNQYPLQTTGLGRTADRLPRPADALASKAEQVYSLSRSRRDTAKSSTEKAWALQSNPSTFFRQASEPEFVLQMARLMSAPLVYNAFAP